jgi:ketosteroid isomerase-like protein
MPPELKHSWEVSFNKGDADAIARLYSGQAELVMTGAPPVKGPEAIRAAVEQMIRSGAKVEIGSAQNVGAGDIAYVYGPYAVRDHEGGKVIEQGSFLEVWRKRNGTWQIDLDVNSTGAAPNPANTP